MTAHTETVSPDQLRAAFALALSEMYRGEIPQYGTLLELVADINQQQSMQFGIQLPSRIDVERHGAIRLGTAEKLAMTGRLFSVMGMHPVGYYDLTVAGLPVHATCFRPLLKEELARNPFRVFTSLLRLDLIQDEGLRAKAATILEKRHIFTPRCVQLVKELEKNPAIPKTKAEELLQEALETFRWHKSSTTDMTTYKALQKAHPLIADIVCFRGPHINHLTPRVLDIEAAQTAMRSRGLQAKEEIEGPPLRKCPILMRQTSFLALEEAIAFSDGAETGGRHKARFGEIEQRGIALKPKGRELYDGMIRQSRQKNISATSKKDTLKEVFKQFPDDLLTLRKEGLAYFTYTIGAETKSDNVYPLDNIDFLVDNGVLKIEPITYEDFLPISAAGIFHSNLGSGDVKTGAIAADQPAFEAALGSAVMDSFQLYENMESQSMAECLMKLSRTRGLKGDVAVVGPSNTRVAV